MAMSAISSAQTQALFDILTHYEAYQEIKDLRRPDTINHFGEPLEDSDGEKSSPLIQILIKRFLLILPGLRDVSTAFWRLKIKDIFNAFAQADLSESYDKGSIGIRKTLATASAAMVEFCARGTLGGCPKSDTSEGQPTYSTTSPDDVAKAWDDFLQQIVYGDMIERMFAKASSTDQLSEHESLVQATHEYVFVIMASFLHYILVISPRGQSLLPLLIRTKDLLPWFVIRQTLKVGNAATMLNGMVRLLLAKMNMSTVTQWFGAAKSDKGMNLLQQIISTVLGWDSSELRKRATAIEKDNNAPEKPILERLRQYCACTPDEHENFRSLSIKKNQSIVMIILEETSKYRHLSEQQHKLALEYLAVQLAIQDRERIIQVLCLHQPDLLTSAVEDLALVYEPIIRALHNAVDLSAGTSDLQSFLHDLVDLSRISSKGTDKTPPSVEDYVRLLKKHQGSTHRFIHQALKNGKELNSWYLDYAKHAAAQYRQKSPSSTSVAGAGNLTKDLGQLISALSDRDKSIVKKELKEYAQYLQTLNKASEGRMKMVVKNCQSGQSSVSYGPGTFLAKWQALIDETPITPATRDGMVRHGGSDSVQEATRVDVDGSKKGNASALQESKSPGPPNVSNTLRLLLPGFRKVLVELSAES